MTATPLVSVIIPCYRLAHYLPEAIDSALAQTYSHVEVIVVDDGSPDDTEAVARRYGDRIAYVRRANGGLSAARNSGMARARGVHFKFLDADDHLHPEQLARQVEALAGRTDRVSLTTVRLYRDGAPDDFLDHVPWATALLPDLFRPLDWGGIHGFLIPAELARAAGGFDESLAVHEDWDLLVRVGMRAPGLLTDPRVGAYYRQRAGSLSTRRSETLLTRARKLIEVHDELRDGPRPDWFGIDLLRAEKEAYYGLLLRKLGDAGLRRRLLQRIGELERREGPAFGGWRFRALTRLVGYALAERLRVGVVRLLQIRPPETLDTAAWRQNT
jgi:glycosyltransferase involved in cell wall biosynthesis